MREPGASEIPLRELQGPLVSLQSVYTWAAVCLLITEGYGELSRTPHVGVLTNPCSGPTGASDSALLFYFGAPAVAFFGSLACDVRAERLFRLPAASALTAYDIELKMRFLLHASLWGHPTHKSSRMISSGSNVDTAAVAATSDVPVKQMALPDAIDAADDTETLIQQMVRTADGSLPLITITNPLRRAASHPHPGLRCPDIC